MEKKKIENIHIGPSSWQLFTWSPFPDTPPGVFVCAADAAVSKIDNGMNVRLAVHFALFMLCCLCQIPLYFFLFLRLYSLSLPSPSEKGGTPFSSSLPVSMY
uniref:Uncharacterized protein n=1 Tax=Cacopsylla melanoneura TaxID=428564 RepID=A0A8D8XC47_9HEMI